MRADELRKKVIKGEKVVLLPGVSEREINSKKDTKRCGQKCQGQLKNFNPSRGTEASQIPPETSSTKAKQSKRAKSVPFDFHYSV